MLPFISVLTTSLFMPILEQIYNKILTIDDLVMLFFDKAPQMLFKLVMLFNDNISFLMIMYLYLYLILYLINIYISYFFYI